jgi:uncharacterized membrane protein YvbJ
MDPKHKKILIAIVVVIIILIIISCITAKKVTATEGFSIEEMKQKVREMKNKITKKL